MDAMCVLLFLTVASIKVNAQTIPRERIAHVTVVDVISGSEQKDQTVEMSGGRITSISASISDSSELQAGAIDAHGGFLIPGLWDMHVHVHNLSELPLYIANGVTGIRIMSGEKDTKAFRGELAKQTVSPQIYLASAIVDGPGPMWPGSIVIKNSKDARIAVNEIKASGADFIKVYDGISRTAYFALADEAKKQGLAFEGHVPEQITAQEASAAGQRSIEHLTGVALGCSNAQRWLMSDLARAPHFKQKLAIEAEGFRSVDPAKCQALLSELRKNKTWQVPTLTVERMWSRLDDRSVIHDSRSAYIDKVSREHWDERVTPQVHRWGGAEYSLARGLFATDKKLVGLMFRSEVPIMAGTDAMNPYCFPGFSLHDELALLVNAGLTPLAALQSATINPAKFIGRTQDEGAVSIGKIANLVLLDADPLADIHNTTHIQAVWLEGHYYDRRQLDQMLALVKQQATK